MNIFLTLLAKLMPLYLFITLGFIAGRVLKVEKKSIASLLIYIIAPLIVFNGVVSTPLNSTNLSLPILFFICSSVICLFFYYIAKFIWEDTSRNLLAFVAGAPNVGYFGIPVAIALFNKDQVSLVVLSVLGIILFENSVGFFIAAQGNYLVKDSIKKLFRLPSFYAFFIGLFVNLSNIELGEIYRSNIGSVQGAYSFLGMMLIGLALSGIKKFKVDFKFIGISLLAKFLVWPSIILAIVWLDSLTLQIYNEQVREVMILLSIVPIAANTVAYATELKIQPEKASVAVLLSTLLALVIIPIVSLLFF